MLGTAPHSSFANNINSNGVVTAGNAPLRKIRAAFSRQSSSSQEETSRRKVGEFTKSGTAQGNSKGMPNGAMSPATLAQMRGGKMQHGQLQTQHQKQQHKLPNQNQQPPATVVVQPRMGIGSTASNGENNSLGNGGPNVHPTAQTAAILTIEG
jgi:hypothetical protein